MLIIFCYIMEYICATIAYNNAYNMECVLAVFMNTDRRMLRIASVRST